MYTMWTKNKNISDVFIRELEGIEEKIIYMAITIKKNCNETCQ